MSGPLKALLPEYKRIEKAVETAIFAKFEIPYPLPKAVKAADLSVLAAEQDQIMPPGTSNWMASSGVKPAEVKIKCLSPTEAKEAFLKRFEDLCTQRQPKCAVLVR